MNYRMVSFSATLNDS